MREQTKVEPPSVSTVLHDFRPFLVHFGGAKLSYRRPKFGLPWPKTFDSRAVCHRKRASPFGWPSGGDWRRLARFRFPRLSLQTQTPEFWPV